MTESCGRQPGWRERLNAVIEAARRKPFEYGVFDCALFQADCVEALTGHDFAAADRGKYKTLRGGLGRLRRKGFDDHFAFWASLYAEAKPVRAQVGDLAFFDGELPAGGIVIGAQVMVLHPGGCLGTMPLSAASRILRID